MRWLIFLTAAVSTFALDQATKGLAERFLPLVKFPQIRSWALQQTLNRKHYLFDRPASFLLLWTATVLLTLLWLRHSNLASVRIAYAALGAAIGGCTGNTFDRLVRGGVIDFIAFPRVSLFNLADVAIVTAAGLLAHTYLVH
jgi:lipoprotein signal peptidase